MMINDQQKPIRILHVLTAMNRAGTETMLMNLYRVIDREQIQFDFAVTSSEHCDYDDEILSLGGKIIRYPRYKGYNHFSYVRWWELFYRAHPEYIIVHGHIGSTASIYLRIAKKHKRFAIAHCHSVGQCKSIHDLLYKLYSYSTRYIADYFIGCSEKALISRYGKKVSDDKSKSTILKNSIDVKKYTYSPEVSRKVKRELNIENNSFVIGTVGRFTEAKNPYFIVDILNKLKKKNHDFIFLWAGTGELKPDIEKYINDLNLNKEIILLGVRNDVPRILQAFNVFILPSKYEGLPVVGVEAQAAGLPILCSENVTRELKVSDCVKFLPIKDEDIWVNAILETKEFKRIESAPEDVIKAGYDVISESQKLMTIYKNFVDIVGVK